MKNVNLSSENELNVILFVILSTSGDLFICLFVYLFTVVIIIISSSSIRKVKRASQIKILVYIYR